MLGRGLESLIPNKSQKEEKKLETQPSKASASEAIFQIEIDKISVNPFQPRKNFDQPALRELANSIREYGILQPLIVSKIEKETERGTEVEYELIAGERRLQAAKILRLDKVPAIVRNAPQQKEKLEIALIENIQRENLNPLEAARAYAKLQDTFGLTQREIATKVGKSRETIANMVRLLNLPTHIQEALTQNKVSESQARLLLAVSDASHQEELFNDITRNNLSVRQLKNKIFRIRGQRTSTAKLILSTEAVPAPVSDPELIGLQYTLEEALGTKVKVEKRGQSGELSITFSSPEDLQVLIKKLLGEDGGVEL